MSYMNVVRTSLATVVLLFCAMTARADNAQDATTSESRDSDAISLDEIVVTARRREESAQTVPVSISAFSADALRTAGVQSTNDLQMFIPGVILNGAGTDANTTYTIRGQSKAVIGPGLPSVTSYFDDVPLPSWGSVLPTFDVSNVQVLKGPQGTLFGRNTTGGAILVYPTSPTFNSNGYIQVEFGSYAEHSFEGALNMPLLDDKLAVRIAGDVERRSGYSTNLLTGQRDDNKDTDAVRASILFVPVRNLADTLVYDYFESHSRTAIAPILPPLDPALAPAVAAAQPNGPYSFESTVPSVNKNILWGVANTTKLIVSDSSIKNTFGYRSTNIYDADGAAGLGSAPLPLSVPALGLTAGTPGVLLNTVTARVDRQISDEVQVTGKAFDSMNWLIGAFYLDDAPNGPDYLDEDVFRPTSPSPATLYIVNNYLGGIWPIGTAADNLYSDRSRAFFGAFSYDLLNAAEFLRNFTLNLEYRYTWDTEGICANSRPAILLTTGQSVVAPYQSSGECRADPGGFVLSPANPYAASFSRSVSDSAPTYTLGVDYKVNDDVFLYFTTRSGYRAGGLNAPSFAGTELAPYQNFGPQKVTDYEVGVHANWQEAASWKGRLNLDVFTGRFTSRQLQATGITAGSLPGITADNTPTNTSVTLNAGSATISGVELDGVIAPFSDLAISYGASYLNPKQDSSDVPAFLQPYFSSGPFTGTPRWSYIADARYKLPATSVLRNVYFDVYYYHVDEEYQGFTLLPGYSLTNLNARWLNVANRPVDITLFVDNIGNREYIHNVLLSTSSFGLYSGDYGPPRMYGVRVRYDFGR